MKFELDEAEQWKLDNKDEWDRINNECKPKNSISDNRMVYMDMQGKESAFPFNMPDKLKIFPDVEEMEILEEFAVKLNDDDKLIIGMRYCGYTQREIGLEVGLSQARISQILRKLRKQW